MNRTALRRFIERLVLLAALIGPLGCGGKPPTLAGKGKGMNVALIVIDTLRADHLSAYGYARETSPNLERLQRRGVRFERAFVQCNFSGGSYASIFTGLYPHSHGVRNHPLLLDERHDTLAELFERAGYRTFGRHGHGYLRSRFRYDQGFQDYAYRKTAAQTTADVLEFLANVGHEPFFLFVQYKDPHYAYEPPDRFRDKWLRQPSGFYERVEPKRKNMTRLMFGFDDLGYRKDDFDYQIALYDGEIAYMDELLGDIDAALRRHGLEDDTIVIVTSDHGEALREHGTVFNHDGTLYDEVIRVPLLITNPTLFPDPRTVPEVVQSIDILPTATELTGLDDPDTLDGSSLLRLLDEPEDGRLAFAEGRPLEPTRARLRSPEADPIPHYRVYLPGIVGKWRSVRSATHKLIYIPRKPEPEWELYDLANDPGERVNLIGREASRPAQELLARALSEWMALDPGIAAEVEMTREVFEQLKELGYVEGEFSPDPHGG